MNPSPLNPQSAKRLSLVLGLSMLVVGVCGLSYEYSFSRLATGILGDSTKQWALVIGVMMFFMGLGADLQKHLGNDQMVERFIGIEILLGLLGGFGPSLSLYAFGYWNELFVVVHYLLIAGVGLLIGLEIPLLVRVNELCLPSLKDNLGLILKMDYAGSFIGALAWVFVLPRFLDLLEIPYLLGLLNVFVALGTLFFFRTFVARTWVLGLTGVLAAGALGLGLWLGEPIRLFLEQRLYKDPVVLSQTSRYQLILFTQNAAGRLDCFINGHLQFSSRDEQIYHEFLVHPALSALQSPKRVLVLGGGDGLAVRELLRYPGLESVTLVDLDPVMTGLAQEYPPLVALNQGSLKAPKVRLVEPQGVIEGERVLLEERGNGFFKRLKAPEPVEVSLFHLDAFNFARSAPGTYDLILLDFPDPNDPELSKLYSLEFYRSLKGLLNPQGLMVQQSTSPSVAHEAFLIIGRTLQEAGFSTLALHQVIPSFGDWGFWVAGAAEDYPGQVLGQQVSRPRELPPGLVYLTSELIGAAQVFGKGQLDMEGIPVNRLLAERLFEAYHQAWARQQ